MRNFIFLILILLVGVTISACKPRSISQVTQEPVTENIPEIIEPPLPSQEEVPHPTENPTAIQTSTPEPTLTAEEPSSTIVILDPTATNTTKPSTTATFEPTEIMRGNFYGVDENHMGSGKAVIIQTKVGEFSLYLENFNVTNGPDLHIILAEEKNPYSVATLGDYLDLGELKSTTGDQAYALPADVNLEKYGSVVVYCVPFQAIFAIAPIK
jgi:hypothetical protein